MVTALMRAHHARCDPDPLVVDPWGDALVPDAFRTALAERGVADSGAGDVSSRERAFDAYLRSIPSYASVILRTRYAEDQLERAAQSGVTQYVSVGAGFDSFALRRPPYAATMRVFEVDHSATQNVKREQLARRGIREPALTYFVAADLSKESIAAALRRAPFRFGERAFFSWLGVTIYLSHEANTLALRAFADCGAAGSLVVFTYTDERAFDPVFETEGFRRTRVNAAQLGEPFVSGFKPREMPGYLRSLGLELVQDLDGPELEQRYFNAARSPRLASSPDSHIALARVI